MPFAYGKNGIPQPGFRQLHHNSGNSDAATRLEDSGNSARVFCNCTIVFRNWAGAFRNSVQGFGWRVQDLEFAARGCI